jgi:uncharacterized membrane protein YkoI
MKLPAVMVLVTVMALTLFSGSVFALTISEMPAIAAPVTAPLMPYTDELPLALNGAVQIALASVGGGIVEEIEFERKGGNLIYEITVRRERGKYELKIDGATGEILDFERETTFTSARQPGRPLIPFENAIDLAVAALGGGTVEDIELEREWGKTVYEVGLRQNGRQFEVKLNAETGAIISIKQ